MVTANRDSGITSLALATANLALATANLATANLAAERELAEGLSA